MGDACSNNFGNILSLYLKPFSVFLAPLLPYINIFFFLEWAWKSQNNTTSLSSINLRIRLLVANIVGCNLLLGSFHCLFKSTPARLHLLLPLTTPSMLSIGTTLNTNCERSSLASSDGPVRKSIRPCSMYEAYVSPGCTRDDRTTPSLFFLLIILLISLI